MRAGASREISVAICVIRAIVVVMADLRINNIPPELLAKLKIAAIKSGHTLREYVIALLERAA